MSADHRDKPRRRQHRSRYRQRRRYRPSPPERSFDEGMLTDEERSYRDAHRIAERKVKLARDASRIGLIGLALLIFIPPVGAIMLIWCGIGLFKEFYQLIVEPKVRDRLIEHELDEHIYDGITRERQTQEGRHARSLEHLSASIAHEIRNPITAAKSLVQQMEEEPTASENVEYARVALEELHRVEKSVSHLLRFARDENSRIERVKMADVVDSALDTFRDRLERSGIKLERQIDCMGELRGDPEQLRRIVINLVGNAIDALTESATPEPHIDVQMGENLAGSEVWLRVRDNGPGVDRELLAKMFSPFYTSKVNGTGLGLAICKKLVDAHSGSIEVTSEPGDGAEFIVTFPKAASEQGVPA
jgi:signal transduction histidine kinase